MRWWTIEVLVNGQRRYIGRTEATAAQMREAVGPYATLEANGLVTVWARP